MKQDLLKAVDEFCEQGLWAGRSTSSTAEILFAMKI